MSLSVFVDVLLSRASSPFREYARLACTCKEMHTLLGSKVQAHKWATFYKAFLLQLDFVEMFTASQTKFLFSIPGHSRYGIVVCARRDWDFVKEVVTVTVTPERDTMMWDGWEFAYVYDPSKSSELNLYSINWQMARAASDHMMIALLRIT